MAMTAKTKSGKRIYSYRGDLNKAVEEAEKELDKRINSQDRVFLKWQFERAKKAHDTYEQRISDLKGFIRLARYELQEEKEEKDGETE